MFDLKSKILAVTLFVLGVVPIDDAALADVPLRCDNSVCGCSVFDAIEVHILEIASHPLPTTISKQIPELKSSLQEGTIIFGPGAVTVAPIAFRPAQEAAWGSGQFVQTGPHSPGMPNGRQTGIAYPTDLFDCPGSALAHDPSNATT